MAASAGHLILLQGIPRAPGDVPKCLSRAVWKKEDPEQCDFPDAPGPGAIRIQEAERAVASALENASCLDLSDLVCPQGICPAMAGSVVRYRDADHLTASFVETLAPAIENRLLAALGGGGGRFPPGCATIDLLGAS